MNVPDPREELDRKVIEELQRLEFARVKQNITPEQYTRGVQTLWNATAGLVSEDVMNLLGMAPKETDALDYRAKWVFLRDTHLVKVERSGVKVTTEVGELQHGFWNSLSRKTLMFDSGIEAAEKVNAIMQSVVNKGFQEI